MLALAGVLAGAGCSGASDDGDGSGGGGGGGARAALCPGCLGGTMGPCRSPSTQRCYNFVADYDPTNPTASLCPAGSVFCAPKAKPFVSDQFVNDLCGGTTEAGHTAWQMYGEDGLNAEVDTRKCELPPGQSPAYVASITEGDKSNEWAGASVIYVQDHVKFKLYLFHDYLRGAKLLAHAQLNWRVSWVVDRSTRRSGTFVM